MRALLAVAAFALGVGASLTAHAHHVGVFIPKDDDLTKNFKEIKFAATARRFGLALRFFDEGIIHATMEKREKSLPRGLEDGLRAALTQGDLPGVELRLAIFLAFLTDERLTEARARLTPPGVPPERRRDQARKLINAAWRYYNLADFVIAALDVRAAAALRMGFEDAQTFLGGMMVDPMWAGAARAKPARPDETRAAAVMEGMSEVLRGFRTDAARVARAGGAGRFLPR